MKLRVMLILVGMLLASCSAGAADIALDQVEFDLGPVINGEMRTIEIPLYNLGDVDLVIEAVTTSCGCTQATVSPTTISPGESALLVVQFDSGVHGPEETGPVERQVFIASNDGDEPEIVFRFTAQVIARE